MVKNKCKNDIESEPIRLAIQAGIVASCLVVITGGYETLGSSFQLLVKNIGISFGPIIYVVHNVNC